jgi:hypothetical protein
LVLSELLDYVASVYLDDRTDLVDGDPDELWSDATIVRFLAEGERIICRRAWSIIEYGVAPAGVITLQTGKILYPLHPSVLRVYDLTPATQDGPLGRWSDLGLRDPTPPSADAFDRGEAASLAGAGNNPPGASIAFATDSGTRAFRVWPAPSLTENGVQLYLRVARMPINALSLDNLDKSPEIPEEQHMALADYAAARCLLLPNVDSDQKAEGRLLLADFHRQVLEFRQDRQRAERDNSRWAFSSATSVLR